MDDVADASGTRPTGTEEELAGAVVAVCSEVLGTDVGPDDEFDEVCADLFAASHIAGLLNQWLGCRLAVARLFGAGTPRRLAGELAAAGTPTPPGPPTAAPHRGPGAAGARPDREPWRNFWEATYRFSGAGSDFDTAGWFTSRTLTPLPDDHMREWLATTADRIESLAPRSVLDVGCGTGMLLFRLGPGTDRYTGTDFSAEAVRKVGERLQREGAPDHIDVLIADARETADAVRHRYDLVLLNSVVQYFPGPDYLGEVLSALVSATTPGGALFLGDLRNADLHRAAHVCLLRDELPGRTPLRRVRGAVQRSMADDPGLLLEPAAAVQAAEAAGLGSRTLVRRGGLRSEMTRFRYDALLCTRTPATRAADRDLAWDTANIPAPPEKAIEREIAAGTQSLLLRGVPDARTYDDARLAQAVFALPADSTLDDAVAWDAPVERADPEAVWEIGAEYGYGVAVAPAATPGRLDIALCRDGDDWAAADFLP